MKREFFALYLNSYPIFPYIIGSPEVMLLQKSVTNVVKSPLSVQSFFVTLFIAPISPSSLFI